MSEGIQIVGVSKSFKEVKALNNINLTFGANKIYGLLGRNGAGKTTLLNVIANRIFADSGYVTIDGLDSSKDEMAQKKLYYMSEQNLYSETTKVMQVFKYTKLFYPGFDMEYAYALCKRFQLDPKKKVRELSTGYTSIYKLITALCVDVNYVFLDEPVLGLDANHRELFYQILLESYTNNPRTFIISTHLIEEVKSVIEDVIVIKRGEVIRQQSCEELLKSGYCVSGKASDVDSYIEGKQVIGVENLGGLKTANLLGEYHRNEIPECLEVTRIDLQKLFIQLTND